MVADAPQGFDLESLKEKLTKQGYNLVEEKSECSSFGDATARTRYFLVGGRNHKEANRSTLKQVTTQPGALKAFLEKEDRAPDDAWLEMSANVIWDPMIRTSDKPSLPKPV